MTTESKIILNAETGQSVKNVKELQDAIKGYKEALMDENATAEQNKETAAALAQAQGVLRDVMNSSTISMEDARKEVDLTGKSYNDLVHEMAALTKVWRTSTDEMERADISKNINKINDELKRLDATKGTFSRNVGNYGNELGQAFTNLGGIIGGPFKGAVTAGNNALKLMSTNPIMAVLMILVPLIQKLTQSLSSSEETMNSVNASMAAFQPIGDAVTKVIQALGEAVAWVVGGFVKLVKAITGTTDAMKERQRIAEMEIELTKRQREETIKNAEAERDAAQLREKAYDKEQYTAKERLEFLKKAGEKEAEIAQRAYEDAKLAYEIQKAKNAITKTSAEDKQKEADAYAALVKAETAYAQKLTANHKEIYKVQKEIAREAREAAKAAQEAAKARLQAEKDLIDQTAELEEKGSAERLRLQKESARKTYEMAVADAKAKIKDASALGKTLSNLKKKYDKDIEALEREHQKTLQSIRVQGLLNIANQYAQGTKEYLKAMKDVRLQELNDVQQEEGETIESYNARRLAAQKAYYEAVRALNKQNVKESTQYLEVAFAEGAHTTENFLAYQMQMAEAQVAHIEKLGKEAGETEAEYLIRLANAKREAVNATEEYLNYQDEQELLAQENKMALLEQGSLEYLSMAVDLKRMEKDTLHRLEEESDAEFYARQLAAEKAYNDAKKALAQKRVEMALNATAAVSGILGSLADIYEADTNASEAELQRAKNLRIAGATIDMLNGVVTAISQAQQLGPIAGPIMAAINSAAVIAAGVANITKMKQQSTSANSSSSSSASPATPAVVSAPQITQEVQTFRSLTSASEEDRLNKMAEDRKVYLVTSELEAHEQDTKVRLEESSF